ncbi:two component transcriptional regulator, winged helix family [Desulfocicer vacuolatum DSM 3385]|uniref:Two component transcriptional regulator, winged helix family n=2 Tax=Desulfocicer vacuolatum TaxID=2298 RepID=A0A1W2DGV5_9BACT|nr:two component transcriptional regulator, winged helix family [Desulfocicer vacuolatum DSM 3385]
MPTMLIIDDDSELCELLEAYLTPEGFKVTFRQDGEKGMQQALSGKHDIVILDIMLPKSNGFEILSHIRRHSAIPVIMLTARGDEVDRIVGLEMGADDYLPKPFNPRELVARVRAVLRRVNREKKLEVQNPPPSIEIGDITLNRATRIAFKCGEPMPLTSVEFDLLGILMEQAGRVVMKEKLVKSVLDRDYSPFDRSIDVHISNLRKKIGHVTGAHERIKTIRSTGYLYVAT